MYEFQQIYMNSIVISFPWIRYPEFFIRSATKLYSALEEVNH